MCVKVPSSYGFETSYNENIESLNGSFTCVEFRDVEHFPPANHIFPLNEKLERVCPLSGRDELWAQKPSE